MQSTDISDENQVAEQLNEGDATDFTAAVTGDEDAAGDAAEDGQGPGDFDPSDAGAGSPSDGTETIDLGNLAEVAPPERATAIENFLTDPETAALRTLPVRIPEAELPLAA